MEESDWNLLMLSRKHILTLILKIMINILNLKLVIIWDYQNIHIFLQKVTQQVMVVKKVKNTVPWTYVVEDLNGAEIVAMSRKDLQKRNRQKQIKVEKLSS